MPTIAQDELSRTALEAMASGRAAIGSRIGGLPDTIVEGVTGQFVEPGNVAVCHMLRLQRSGGLFFMTCAGEGRGEHATARTGKRYGPDAGFYRNVEFWQFNGWLREVAGQLAQLHLQFEPGACDLYCYAIKA